MKKLKFNSTLNHKQSDYKPYEVEVEKVVTLYGRQFEENIKDTCLDVLKGFIPSVLHFRVHFPMNF